MAELLSTPRVAELLASSHSNLAIAVQQPQRAKLALVFGREVSGLTAAEVDLCDATLSIPIGRLQGQTAVAGCLLYFQ
jgi:tRNA C32,U32 (ribose-2'-O)-methylase TrmJ